MGQMKCRDVARRVSTNFYGVYLTTPACGHPSLIGGELIVVHHVSTNFYDDNK